MYFCCFFYFFVPVGNFFQIVGKVLRFLPFSFIIPPFFPSFLRRQESPTDSRFRGNDGEKSFVIPALFSSLFVLIYSVIARSLEFCRRTTRQSRKYPFLPLKILIFISFSCPLL